MKKEYEYSAKVKDIEPFINYCKENNYELINKTAQKRVLYRNSNKILARVTIIEDDKSKNIFLDFKDENESDDVLKISRESGKINVTDNMDFVKSVLSMLEFDFYKELDRVRYVYVKNKVTFEIDEYIKPKMKVVGIEGNKEEVDKVYKVLEDKFNQQLKLISNTN